MKERVPPKVLLESAERSVLEKLASEAKHPAKV